MAILSAKAALKAAKTALDEENYDKAIEQAKHVLSSDPQNYFAKLFLGRAFEKQGDVVEAAKTYYSAAKLKPDDSQAWLGLCSVYEGQGSETLDDYREAAVKVAEIFATNDDKHRCQSIIDKLVLFAKQRGTRTQYRKTLEVLLPGSPIYDALEGRIPHPSNTYMRIAEITEDEETQRISKEISERRTRIGARVGQVTMDVEREVFGRSNLEQLYQQVIDWSTDDEIRRQYEEKLLERAHSALIVLPVEEKAVKLDQALTIAEGMVIIHHPLRRAWDLVLESRDLDNLREFDVGILREYVELFPDGGLARIIKCWLSSELSPFPAPKSEGEDDLKALEYLSLEDRLVVFAEGLSDSEESPLAHRLVCDYYLHLEEHQNAVDSARAGIISLNEESNKLGLTLQNTRDALNAVLATALVQYQAPRNHLEARKIFDDILKRKPKFTPALIGLGLIFEENEDYSDAADFLSKAMDQDKANVVVRVELAWCWAMSGEYSRALEKFEDSLSGMEEPDPKTRGLRAQTLYRIGMCLWQMDPSKSARKDRNGAYSRFLVAIKTNVNFAPAYTSLGIYYADYAKDKKRARQCFQKAFELSTAETVAAERLATSFADQGDWDIVEVIANRVVESGQARPPPGSKKKGKSWPYSALGVAQMNKQEYQQAIVSFLAALRISPDDYQSYVGLGESYHNSGRYNSALRTLEYAIKPHDGGQIKVAGETWFAKYMLANVHRELGEYDEAVAGLLSVLDERPNEFGVLISLVQTYVERAGRCVETGLFGQAVQSAKEAISTAVKITKDVPHAFNAWKAIGDACSISSWIQSEDVGFPLQDVKALLNFSSGTQTYEHLSDVDRISSNSLDQMDSNRVPELPMSIYAAILSFKRGISSCSHDIHAQAVAWYNLGWAEQRAHICSEAKSGKRFLRAAVRCFKRAIELEAANAEFWNALGVATTPLNPQVAQHSFVRSLHLNELNAKVWANLGALYLLQNDIQLASQAFGRSQSTDPDYAQAWLGQGIIALSTGDQQEAFNQFTHAFEISDSKTVLTKRQYATASFDHLLSTASASNDLSRLIQPVFALEQLRIQTANDLACRHLAALFLERVGNHVAAMEELTEVSASAEAEYEASESLSSLARFALAKTDLARNQLVTGALSSAIENAETALDLTSDAGDSSLDAEARRKLRLSAHLTAGLAHYNSNQISSSVAMFRAALVESEQNPDVVCSLVQVLWAQGGENEKSVAHDQLLECVERHPGHVGTVTLLGAIAVLSDDHDTAAAVRDDLLALRTQEGVDESERQLVDDLLLALAAHASDDASEPSHVLSEVQATLMIDPSNPHAWTRLSNLSGLAEVARMSLKTASKTVPPYGNIEAAELAKYSAGVGTIGDAQRAIVLAPWEREVWSGFRDVLAG